MSFEILFPFGLWVSEPGWLLNHSRMSECCGTADSWPKAMSEVLRRTTLLHGEVKSVPPRGQKPVAGDQSHEGNEPHQEREGRTRDAEAEGRR